MNTWFDWWPGGLGWLLVLQLVMLGSMALYRVLGQLIGKQSPNDFFVIFYRTFWEAMKSPKKHPLPINYEPVPPKKKPESDPTDGEQDLDEDDLDALFAADRDEAAADDGEPAATGPAELEVEVGGPGSTDRVLGVIGDVVSVEVDCDPESGRANAKAIGLVATVLRLERHQLSIIHGQAKAQKRLRVVGLVAGELNKRLDEAAGSSAVPEASAGAVGTSATDELDWGDDDEPAVGLRD
ncbi:MAG: DUF167 family protein [Planctomycetota bacterium]